GLLLLAGLALQTSLTLVVVSGAVNLSFLICIIFKVGTSIAGLRMEAFDAVSKEEVAALDDRDLPVYTILVPVYKEANIVAKLLDNIASIDYPSSKLQILLLLEQDDQETINAARAAKPPETVTFVVVPESVPRTKPRACNVGLFFARGDLLVIYDAEDRPEPGQLRDAVEAFRHGPSDLICVQARLSYYNRSSNLLTRLFTLEYSYWFDLMLPGL